MMLPDGSSRAMERLPAPFAKTRTDSRTMFAAASNFKKYVPLLWYCPTWVVVGPPEAGSVLVLLHVQGVCADRPEGLGIPGNPGRRQPRSRATAEVRRAKPGTKERGGISFRWGGSGNSC